MEKQLDWLVRIQAAGVHLAFSLIVALAAAAVVFWLWYPMPYREVSGGRELFTLIVSVDVVMGPLLTLAIFNRKKEKAHLRRDLMIVALLQLAALAYGIHTVWLARPAYLVHEVNSFRVVRAVDLDPQELAKAPSQLQQLPWMGPETIGTRVPQDPMERMRAVELALAGRDIGMRPEYWKPYAEARAEVLASAKPLTELTQRHPDRAAELEVAVQRTGRSSEQLRYLPLMARQTNWVLLVDAKTADVVGYAPFDAYE